MKVTPEQIEAARVVNIVDYCAAHGIPLVHHTGTTYRHAEFDSLKVTGYNWKRHSGKTGLYGRYVQGNAIHFVREYLGLSFDEAVKSLLEFVQSPLISVKRKLKDKQDYINGRIAARTGTPPVQAAPPTPEPQPQAAASSKSEKEGYTPVNQPEYIQQEIKEVSPQRKAQTKASVVLPQRNANMQRLFAYLTKTRGIDGNVVKAVVSRKTLYEEAEHHNCVFVGYDGNEIPRYALLEGTYTGGDHIFKGEVENSVKRYGWCFTPTEEADTLRVYESPIDALSHMTLDLMDGKTWDNKHYLSLGGLTVEPLAYYLTAHKAIQRIEFCLDNDVPGKVKTEDLIAKCGKNYECENCTPTSHKDYNDVLKAQRGLVEK